MKLTTDAPCRCAACLEAGIERPAVAVPGELVTEPRGRKRYTKRWIHGDELERWWLAREALDKQLADVIAKHGMDKHNNA